jgi:hypothetical protein
MNLPMNISMSRRARNLTLLGLATGVALIPLVRYGISRFRNSRQPQEEGAPPNNLFSAYRGKFKPHHRKATQDNGVH